MMQQTGIWHCFPFLFLLFMLHLSPILAFILKDCTILFSENATADVSVDCVRRHLNSIPDNIPRDVTLLTLEQNNILKIKRTDLNNLMNLRELKLSLNSITEVDDGAFGHLGELKVLLMNYNELTTLTDNMFQGLSNLLLLDLDSNNIISINPSAFQLLHSLNVLYLKCNKIHQMTDIITILQLPRLHVLEITIYELVSFQSTDLPLNMSSELRELTIVSDSIQKLSITTAVFPNLMKIDLIDCCNRSGWEWDIPQKDYLRNITEIYFGYDKLYFNTIRKSLQNLDSLEHLGLSYLYKNRGLLNIACNISTLRTLDLQMNEDVNISELTTCTQLTNLYLSGSHVAELPKDSINQMKQLSHLNLDSNSLYKVPDDIKNLSMLQNLNLNDNQIYYLSCSDFLHLSRLTHLHLEKNHITEMRGCVFQPLTELKVLTMNGNFIQELGTTFWTGSETLEFLDLNNNFIKYLQEGDLKSLKSLKHLDVDSGGILNNGWLYDSAFEGPVGLKDLKLQSFRLESTDVIVKEEINVFNGLDELETLRLTSLMSYRNLPLLKSLKRLTIQSNGQLITPNISYITFKHTPNLEVLDLSNNKLKFLDFLEQSNLTRLSWLDLSQNELTVINVSVFSFLPALRYLKMSGNLFACECSNSDFQQWILNNSQTQVVDAYSYTCGYPLMKRGTRFLDFDIHSCWMDTSFVCYISSTCVIVLTLLTSFTYHFLRLHLLYAYYLFLAFLYDAQKRKRGSPQHYDAFISYNVHDELWVYREMLPVMEGEQGWRLCLHHRDFLPGKAIIENITEAIYGSRKTICVISQRYLESEWCSREIQMASYRLFDEKKDVLILVFLEDIPAQRLSPYFRLRRMVKGHTYLSWTQAGQHPGLFWQNLRRALDTPDTDLCLNE